MHAPTQRIRMIYVTLFVSAFLAATFLPFYSELVLIGLVLDGHPKWALWGVATAGNSLGSGVNWIMGRYLLHFQGRRWFPFKPGTLDKTQAWFQRYGAWTLLFSWLPVGGDALPFIAGVMRINPWLALGLCALGKGARYAVLVWPL